MMMSTVAQIIFALGIQAGYMVFAYKTGLFGLHPGTILGLLIWILLPLIAGLAVYISGCCRGLRVRF